MSLHCNSLIPTGDTRSTITDKERKSSRDYCSALSDIHFSKALALIGHNQLGDGSQGRFVYHVFEKKVLRVVEPLLATSSG